MKKFILILIASIGISFYLSAQSAGDYRSIGSGNWNDATKWQRYNGSSWISITTYPGQNPGTGGVSIMPETEIKVTETVPHPLTALSISIDDPNILPPGLLTFSAETAVSLMVSGDVYIAGELKIDNQNGTKTHELFIGGNFIVYGGIQTTNQDDKLGLTFNSTASCLIVSSSGLNVHDITFNCAGTLFVYTNIFITGTATFINGIVRTMEKDAYNGSDLYLDYDILFGDGSTVSGGSNASFIIGRVCKYGIEPFTFPTGHEGFYAPLTISAIDQPEWICAGYSRNNGDWAQAPITDPELFSVNPCDLWSVYRYYYDFIINTSIDVTVGWTSPTPCGSFYIANVSDIVLANFDGSTWNSHGGTSTGTTTNGSVTWSGYNFPSSFSLGNGGTYCRTPSGLNSTNITTNSATVNWSALPGAVSYDVEYKTQGSNTWTIAATATASTSIVLSGLGPFPYDWKVKANCSSGSSPYTQSQFTLYCGSPTGYSITNYTPNSVTLGWGVVTDALSYDVDYKRSIDISWLPAVTGTTSATYNLSGLSASTEYNWRVKANCSGNPGNYMQGHFTTLAACVDSYEINNTSNQAKTIILGVAISAIISSTNDVDWFKVTTPNNSNTNLEVVLSNLPADYDLYVYNKNLQLVASSVNTGTANEVVIYNSNARKATYYIKVIGKNGAYNTSQCYNLLAQAFSSGNRTASHASVEVNEVNEVLNNHLLYPNPASEFVYLNFNSATEGLVNIQIVNSIGQLVKKHPVNTIKGHNQFKIQVADIRPGMYILRINKGDLNLTKKFVIAR